MDSNVKAADHNITSYNTVSLVTTQYHQLQHNIASYSTISPVTIQYHQFQHNITSYTTLSLVTTQYHQLQHNITSYTTLSLVTTQYHQLQHSITSYYTISPVTPHYHQLQHNITSYSQLQSCNWGQNCILLGRNSALRLFLLEYFLLLTIKKGRPRKRYEFPQFYSKSENFTPLAMSKGKANIGRLAHGRPSNIGRSIPNCYGAIAEKCETAEQTAQSREPTISWPTARGYVALYCRTAALPTNSEPNSCEIIENICICFQTNNKCIPSYAKIALWELFGNILVSHV
jgi:hypothetical protein